MFLISKSWPKKILAFIDVYSLIIHVYIYVHRLHKYEFMLKTIINWEGWGGNSSHITLTISMLGPWRDSRPGACGGAHCAGC